MARFFGTVGYILTKEVSPGIWSEHAEERMYYGDIVKRSSRFSTAQTLNDDITYSQEVSIIADPFALKEYSKIRYVVLWDGTKGKVTNVEVQYPRLILSIGGEYHGQAD